jgi:monofunctional biosynthetic peptidoglycan transglycosylase
MIELLWGKKRILEMYLNVIEMGRGVFGIEAAAQKNFKKTAKQLNRIEAAMISSCLPNPKLYTIKGGSKAFSAGPKYPWILQQMNILQNDPDIQALLQ